MSVIYVLFVTALFNGSPDYAIQEAGSTEAQCIALAEQTRITAEALVKERGATFEDFKYSCTKLEQPK